MLRPTVNANARVRFVDYQVKKWRSRLPALPYPPCGHGEVYQHDGVRVPRDANLHFSLGSFSSWMSLAILVFREKFEVGGGDASGFDNRDLLDG